MKREQRDGCSGRMLFFQLHPATTGVFSGIGVARANKKKNLSKWSRNPAIIELNVDVINGNLDDEKNQWRNVRTGLNDSTMVYHSLRETKQNLYLDLKIYLLYYIADPSSVTLVRSKIRKTWSARRVSVIRSRVIKKKKKTEVRPFVAELIYSPIIQLKATSL